MVQYKTRRVITVAVAIVVITIAIAALASVARVLFFPDSVTMTQVSNSQQALISTTADRSVSMTVRGPIVADEKFRTYQIQISPSVRTITIYKGYTNQVVESTSFVNNTPAYEQFVYALNRANLMRGIELTGDKNDFRGICSNGRVYQFDILNAGKTEKQLWTSTCSGSRGSLNANLDNILHLFNDQIPDVSSIANGLWQ